MNDLCPIHHDLDEATCRGFLSPSPLIVLTPLHPPPLPPTGYIDMGYTEVWKSIAQKETLVPSVLLQGNQLFKIHVSIISVVITTSLIYSLTFLSACLHVQKI